MKASTWSLLRQDLLDLVRDSEKVALDNFNHWGEPHISQEEKAKLADTVFKLIQHQLETREGLK